MEEKSVAASPVLLIESAFPVVTEWKIESLYKLTESDWASLQQEAEKNLALNPLDINALHLCALKIRANYPIPACFKTAMDQQEVLANEGNVNAMVNYGYFLYLLEEHDKAIAQLFRAIQKGSAAAMYNRGRMYEFGLGSEENINSALLLYYHAAKLGLEKAVIRVQNPSSVKHKKMEKLYFYLYELVSSHVDSNNLILSILTIKDLYTVDSYSVLFELIASLIFTDQMSQEKFFALYKGFFKNNLLSNPDELRNSKKLWNTLALALQKSYLSLAQMCEFKEHLNVDKILNALHNLGERKLISEIILSELVLSLDPKHQLSEVQSAQIMLLLNGTDITTLHFKGAFRIYLKNMQTKFKKEASLRPTLLNFFKSLPKCTEVKSILDQCVEWHVNDLIARDRVNPQSESLAELQQYSVMLPRVARYIESVRVSLFEQFKNDALNGDKNAFNSLCMSAVSNPEAKYWLGRYYEECQRGFFSFGYDSQAIECYKAVSEWKEPVSDDCRRLAFERLAFCYQEGKLVKKNLKEAYYYHFKAGELRSANSINELANSSAEKRFVVLGHLYLSMIKGGFKGKLSQYYDNSHLITAINFDKELTDAVIIELSNNSRLDYHHQVALLQVAFRHNPYAHGVPNESIIEFFRCLCSKDSGYDLPYTRNDPPFFKGLSDYINPYYFVDVISQFVTVDLRDNFGNYYVWRHTRITVLLSIAVDLSIKLRIDNEHLKQIRATGFRYDLYMPFSDLPQFVDDIPYRVSSLPVQEKMTLKQEIDHALSLSATSFPSRNTSFFSNWDRGKFSTKTNSKDKNETSQTNKL